jgi:hypothetical protein
VWYPSLLYTVLLVLGLAGETMGYFASIGLKARDGDQWQSTRQAGRCRSTPYYLGFQAPRVAGGEVICWSRMTPLDLVSTPSHHLWGGRCCKLEMGLGSILCQLPVAYTESIELSSSLSQHVCGLIGKSNGDVRSNSEERGTGDGDS